MIDFYGSHFEYAGVSSRKYGLIFANVTTKRNVLLSGSVQGAYVFDKSQKRNHLIDDDYSDFPVSFDIEIITDDEKVIDPSQRREIEKWLFNRRSYKKMYLDSADDIYGDTFEIIDGEIKRLFLRCRFLNPERLEYNGGVVGYKATLEADSGMWWQDSITQQFNLESVPQNGGYKTITVHVDTDLDDYIYPKVKITMGGFGGGITIINYNDSDDRQTIFSDLLKSGENGTHTFELNGEINSLPRPTNDPNYYYSRFQNPNFPRLLDGENKIYIMGDVAEISFEYSNRRML